MINLFEHQKKAVKQLQTGSILNGGVGSGKSLTAVVYYYTVECGGKFDSALEQGPMLTPKKLYIITTARKRDTLDWEKECAFLGLSDDIVFVDSWNNIKKYTEIKDSFFIFDEQRVIGSGVWTRSFYKITKKNNWILLSATPGDTWMDYIPVFVANGFYKNRTEFIRRHVVYSPFTKFPKIIRYSEENRLKGLKRKITVKMSYLKSTKMIRSDILVEHDKEMLSTITRKRWNVFKDEPIKNFGSFFYLARRVVNSHPSRLKEIKTLLEKHKRLIIFYNFNYELEILRSLSKIDGVSVSEYNGHKHEPIPDSNSWVYLVQYVSGGEGWNCTSTNVVVFFSQNYSYRIMTQAAGRIDRLNTPFDKLYYYTLLSDSKIDIGIKKAIRNKQKFNESKFAAETYAIIEGD